MIARFFHHHQLTILLAGLALLLAGGWAFREWVHAGERIQFEKSRTINLANIKLEDAVYEGTPRGKVGLYINGQTAGTRNFVVGQFRLRPGMEPHPIHTHPEEEILIVTQGKGIISCNGKKTKVGPGSIMFTEPNVPHGIENTGKEELEFYFVKWIGVPTRKLPK